MKTIEKKVKEKPVAKKVKITRCKLTKKQQQHMIEFFVLGVTARSAADLMALQANTAALFYRKIREVIAYYLAQEAAQIFQHEFVLDESNLSKNNKNDKHAVFGIAACTGKVFTKMTGQLNAELLSAAAPNLIKPNSIVFINQYQPEQAIDVNDCYQEHIHSTDMTDPVIADIEKFWEQTKRVLRKYNGIPKSTFPLFLKECEFRFNYSTPKAQLKTLKLWTGI